MAYSKEFLSTVAFGFPWGHHLSYDSLAGDSASTGNNGRGWYAGQLPYLLSTPEGLVVAQHAINNNWFLPVSGGGFQNKFAANAGLAVDTDGNYVLTRQSGRKWVFFSSGMFMWQLKSVVDASGLTVDLDWNSTTGFLDGVRWESGGLSREYRYKYVPAGINTGLLGSVTLLVNGFNSEQVQFDYYDGSQLGGGDGNLASMIYRRVRDGGSGWSKVSETGFRYYRYGEAGGYAYGLKAILEPSSIEKMIADGVDWKSAPDASIQPYADNWFEYDGSRRVVAEHVRGGQAVSTLSYVNNPAAPAYNAVMTWDVFTLETQPDGNRNRVYTNNAAQPLVKIFEDVATGAKYVQAWQYDSMFRVTQVASPSAVQSVTEPVGGSGPLIVVLKTNEGLLQEWTYYSADDPGVGAAKGFRQSAGVRKGTGGTLEVTGKWTYDTQTVGSYSIHPVKDALTFPIAGTPDASAPRTAYARNYFTDPSSQPTFQVEDLTTTPPVIPLVQHGTASAEPAERVFDTQGRVIWEKNPRGFITFHTYDPATGALVETIEDVNTDEMSGVPEGWSTPAGGGKQLVTTYENDNSGRSLRVLGPWIDVDPATVGAEGDTPLRVRPVDYTFYRDSQHQVWRAKGYMTDDGEGPSWNLIGPVSVTVMDADGRTTDEIQAAPECDCGALGSNSFNESGTLPPQSDWTRWTHRELDLWGRVLETRVYHDIPHSGSGFAGTNYDATLFGYDTMGRQMRVVSPGGTITWSVYDARGLRTETWIGTDDRGATPSDPSGGGTAGNNMKRVWLGVYDNGSPGGDGNLTQVTLPVDDSSSNDRVTQYAYDYRNRLIQTTTNDGTRNYFVVNAYDNLDRLIEQARYHSSVATPNRTHYSTTSYDDRGRVYEQDRFFVNSNGTLGNALVGGMWYDPDGNLIKQTQQGARVVAKTVFDSLDRPVTLYQVSEASSTSGTNTNSVALDTVIEQSENLYNDAGYLLAVTSRARFDDATGTGPLQGPSGTQPLARVSYSASYFDPVGRLRFAANYGTNGSLPWAYSAMHPTPSELILVTEQQYASDGGASSWIDPEGIVTTQQRDQAGRRVRVTENANGVAGSSRVSAFQYAPDGGLLRLILENPTTGQQVTEWLYGTTLADSGVARSDLPVRKTYPTGEDETQTYNRQAEVFTMTDANGSIHGYNRDKLGRLIDDKLLVVGTGVDGTLRRVSTTYDERGRVQYVTTADDPSPGAGSVLSQVLYGYNGIDCLISEAQSHDGIVVTGTPKVQFTCTAAVNNTQRRTAVIYPDGRNIAYEYGASGSIDDVLNRIQTLHEDATLATIAAFDYLGATQPAVSTLP